MNYLAILDLIIGLIFIYFLMGLFCSTVQELIANAFNLRARNLNAWIRDTFNKNKFGEEILNHKLVDGLTKKGRIASYIPSDTFSHTVLDLINKAGLKPYTIESLKLSIQTSDQIPDDFKRKLLQSIEESGGKIQKVRDDVETWFNEAMERISGTYKKLAQKIILVVAIGSVAALNVDTVSIARYLYDHPAEASALADRISDAVSEAKKAKADTVSLPVEKKIEKNVAELQRIQAQMKATQLPIGWQHQSELTGPAVLTKILGLLMTALAAVVGAPFWFDLLNKLVNLRSAGKKPPTDEDENDKKKK